MIRCYEDELIDSSKIEEKKIQISSIKSECKKGKVFRDVHLRMPFATHIKFEKKFALNVLLLLMPIYVVKQRKDEYGCVGNIRCLNLLKMALPLNYKIPVKIVHGNDELVRHMVLIEVFVMPLLFSFGDHRKDVLVNLTHCVNDFSDVKPGKGRQSDASISSLSSVDYLTIPTIPLLNNNVANALTIDCMRLLVEMYPIYLAYSNKNTKYFIGNVFIYQIIRGALSNKKEIPFKILKKKNHDEIKGLSHLSALVLCYVFGMRKHGYFFLSMAIDKMLDMDKSWVFKSGISKNTLANMMGCSVRTLRKNKIYLKSVRVSKEEESEDLERFNIKTDAEGEVLDE